MKIFNRLAAFSLMLFLALGGCAESTGENVVEPNGLLTGDNGKVTVLPTPFVIISKTPRISTCPTIEQTVNFGHDELNGVLSSVPYVDIQLKPTKVFTNEGVKSSDSSSSLNSS